MEEMFHRGHILRALRDQHGWSQRELAERADVNVATVNRAEQNLPTVTDDTWRKLALALSVRPDWLMHAHADPMIAGGGAMTQAVTPPSYGGGSTPSAELPTMTPYTADKARLLHLISALDDHLAAELLPRVWRLVLQAQVKATTPSQPAPPKD